jgi:hypothetical protein
MDPNLFHLDWNRLLEVLAAIVVLSFVLERALSPLFESRFFINSKMKDKSFKEMIALVVCAAVCVGWQFDAISMILLRSRVTVIGAILTGAVIAGGSKASIKLFRDVLGFKSTAQSEYEETKKVAKAGQ